MTLGYGPWFVKEHPISDPARQLISKLLNSDPAARWSIEEVLQSPWYSPNNPNSPSKPSNPSNPPSGLLVSHSLSHCYLKVYMYS